MTHIFRQTISAVLFRRSIPNCERIQQDKEYIHIRFIIFFILTTVTFVDRIIADNPISSSPELIIPVLPVQNPTPFASMPTPTPTTTPQEFVCEYSQASSHWINEGYFGGINWQSSVGNSCVRDALYEAHSQCAALGIRFDQIDDCTGWKVFHSTIHETPGIYPMIVGRFTGDFAAYGYWGDSLPIASYANCTAEDLPICKIYVRRDADGLCQGVPHNSIPNDAQICYEGTYFWYLSPVSLIFDESIDVDRDFRFVKFRLNPNRLEDWSIWKASSGAPLVVYDPEHKGDIYSATQLFGDWTWGGQGRPPGDIQVSLRDGERKSVGAQRPWANGYEPLSLLDTNNDDKLSGSELEPLALWFDHNRNGKSDSGEVVPMRIAGILTLFFTPNRHNRNTNSLWADKGFERLVDGQIVEGRSVDWRGDTASTKAELINRHMATLLKSPTQEAAVSTGAPDKASLAEVSGRTQNTHPKSWKNTAEAGLSGIWQWRTSESELNPQETEGFLGFSDSDDGVLVGHAYNAFFVNNPKANFNQILTSFPLKGKKSKNPDGTYALKFSFIAEGTNRLDSEATFDLRKQIIRGRTTARISIGMKPADLTYNWTATRIKAKSAAISK